MIIWRKHTDIETMERGKFPTIFSSSKPCRPNVITLELPTLCAYPSGVFKSLVFHSWIYFFWHSHLHVCQLIFPVPFTFFLLPLLHPIFSCFFPVLFSFLLKVLGSCCPPDTMSFSPQFPNVNLYFERHYHIVRAMVFPALICGCESWTIKKPERQRIDAFELWC